jgi:molybdopterin converting factor small subunit
VDALGAPRALAVSNLVGDLRADLDRKLNEDDRVTLMPPFTGG